MKARPLPLKQVEKGFGYLCALVSLTGTICAATINVPADYAAIQAAVNAANAGDTIQVAAGTYLENVLINKENLVVQASGDALIAMDTVPGGEQLGIVNIIADGVVFDGFEVKSNSFTTIRGIEVHNADNVTIRNTEVHYVKDVLIYPNNAHFLTVENCLLHDNWDRAVKPSSSLPAPHTCDDVLIRGCTIYSTDGIWVYSGSRWTIENNEISGWRDWSSEWPFPYQNAELGIAADSNGGHIIRNNVIYAVAQAGIKLESNNCTIVNNTIAFCHNWDAETNNPLRLQTESAKYGLGIRIKTVSGAIIRNNILAYNYRGIGIYSGYNGPDAASVIENNDVFGHGVAGLAALGYVQGQEWDYEDGETTAAGYAWDPALAVINPDWQAGQAGNIQADPGFTSLYPVDFHLQQGSVCIDAGTDTGAPSTDYAGTGRPADGNNDGTAVADMGAYEAVRSNPSGVFVNAGWAGTVAGEDPDGGAGPATEFGYDAFALIQDGIDAVESGGIITVAEGTYAEELNIDKPVTVQGETDGEMPLITLPAEDAAGITLQADNVTLDYLYFLKESQDGSSNCILSIPRGGAWDAYTIAYGNIMLSNLVFEGGRRGAFITGSDVTITNCQFLDQSRDALYFNAVAGTTTIVDNFFRGDPATSKKAILFENFSSADPPVSGTILIEGNVVEGKNNFVVYDQWLGDSTAKINLQILNNTVTGLGSSAIAFVAPGDFSKFTAILIQGNTILNSTSKLIVYLDYTYGGDGIPADGQIQVYGNTLSCAQPWGTDTDTVHANAPVGYSDGAPAGMTLDVFDLQNNHGTAPPWFPSVPLPSADQTVEVILVLVGLDGGITIPDTWAEVVPGDVVLTCRAEGGSLQPEDYKSGTGLGRNGLLPGSYEPYFQIWDQDAQAFGTETVGDQFQVTYDEPESPTDLTETSTDAPADRNWDFRFNIDTAQGFILEIWSGASAGSRAIPAEFELNRTITREFSRPALDEQFPVTWEDTQPFVLSLPEGTYSWRVRAFNPRVPADGSNTGSTELWAEGNVFETGTAAVELTVPQSPDPTTFRPVSETALNVNDETQTTTVDFAWDPVTGVASYWIYVGTMEGKTLINQAVTIPGLDDVVLPPGTYRWTAKACNEAGQSDWASPAAQLNIRSVEQPTVAGTAVTGQDPGSVTFTWVWNGRKGTGVDLMVVNAGTQATSVYRDLDPDAAVFTTGIVESGMTYYFKSRGLTATGNSGPWNTWGQYIMPGGVALVTVTAGNVDTSVAGQVTFTWAWENMPTGARVRIQIMNGSTFAFGVRNLDGTANATIAEFADAGVTYHYRLLPLDATGNQAGPWTGWNQYTMPAR